MAGLRDLFLGPYALIREVHERSYSTNVMCKMLSVGLMAISLVSTPTTSLGSC